MLDKNHKLIFTLLTILIIAQASFTIYFIIELKNLNNNISSQINNLENSLETTSEELQNQITELTNSLMETQINLTSEISKIKATTSSDFSGIIETAVKSIVSIRTNVAQGTGFLITSNGYIVTNAHVLEGAKFATAITSEQKTISMNLIGYNSNLDIALLKIKGSYNFLKFGNSDNVKVGEKVIAIGNPLGLSFSATEGIISAVDRTGDNKLPIYLQTDTALNPGNSGGPLINTEGKVIGINNFKIAGENLGFALESNSIVEEVNNIALEVLNMTII